MNPAIALLINFAISIVEPRRPRFPSARLDIVADSIKTAVSWKSVIFSLKYKAQQKQLVLVSVLANYLWRSEIQVQNADDEDDADVVIDKKVVELSQICEFVQTRNNIIFICVTIAHIMAEFDITCVKRHGQDYKYPSI